MYHTRVREDHPLAMTKQSTALAIIPFNASDAQDMDTALVSVVHHQKKVLLEGTETEVEAVHAVIVVAAFMAEVVAESADEEVATTSMKLK